MRGGSQELHQDNMPVCFIPPYTPLLYSKIGVYRGIHNFLIFALNRLRKTEHWGCSNEKTFFGGF